MFLVLISMVPVDSGHRVVLCRYKVPTVDADEGATAEMVLLAGDLAGKRAYVPVV